MKKFTREGVYQRYRVFRGLRILSGCLYCQGAIVWCPHIMGPSNKPGISKCFHCGRMFLVHNGYLKLWPYREYEHLKPRNRIFAQ